MLKINKVYKGFRKDGNVVLFKVLEIRVPIGGESIYEGEALCNGHRFNLVDINVVEFKDIREAFESEIELFNKYD
jgi:hypothetical protein